MSEELWDVVVVGAGAAGLSAALVLARARRRVLVVDAGEQRNRVTDHMHGVLGHDGRNPADLLADGRREVAGYGASVIERHLETIEHVGREFVLDGEIRSRTVLVATGGVDELPAIEGLGQHWGEGAVACPYCDGYEARDSRIGVINGAHQALMLKQWSDDVTLFASGLDEPTRTQLRRRGVMIDERSIDRVVGARGALEGLELDGMLVPFDRLFVATVYRPRDELLRALGADFAETRFGELAVLGESGATSVDGVWAAGNVSNGAALVPIAMGEGVAAATAINMHLTMADVAQEVLIRA